jgi:hypothetical protein
MSNDVARYEEDDGFGLPGASNRLIRGLLVKWDADGGWRDRDGMPPPTLLLVVSLGEVLQRWKDKVADTITEKPLPDPELLNSTIPVSEWELGMDDRPRPPWQHVVIVYLVNPASAEFYTYMNSTIGAHMAWDALREQVAIMRMLRGVRVLPVVQPTERPFKTKFGMKTRPHFQVLEWREARGGPAALSAKPAAQIAGPTTAAAASSTSATVAPTTETINKMAKVDPPTLNEVLDDEIVF